MNRIPSLERAMERERELMKKPKKHFDPLPERNHEPCPVCDHPMNENRDGDFFCVICRGKQK